MPYFIGSSFRTPGRAATTQNLLSISNATGSGVVVEIRQLTVQIDNTSVANVSWANQFKASRIGTAPTNGTLLTPTMVDSTESLDASVTVRGDASADGTGSGTTLTATLGTICWHQFGNRLHTAVGQVIMDDSPMIPVQLAIPIKLRANEHLVVGLLANATAANGATVMYIVNYAGLVV